MKNESKSAPRLYNTIDTRIWLAKMFVRGIGPQKIEGVVAITFKDIKERCQVCGIFLKWKGIICPCCQNPLRSKPHNRKRRRRIRIIRRNQLENKN